MSSRTCYKGVACPAVVDGVGRGRVEGLPLFMVSHQLVLFRSPGPRAFPTTLLPMEWLRQKESFGPSQLGLDHGWCTDVTHIED